jgi:Zn-dependent protease with chaperone function
MGMGVIYSISFIIGNLLAYIRLASLIKKVVLEWNVRHLALLLMMMWVHVAPVAFVFFFYNSGFTPFYHLLMIAALVVVGFRWTKIWWGQMDDFEELIKFNGEVSEQLSSQASTKLRDESLVTSIKFYVLRFHRNIVKSIFWRRSLMSALFSDTISFPPSTHVTNIFKEIQKKLEIENVTLLVENNDRVTGRALLKPIFSQSNNAVILTTRACEELPDEELSALIAHEMMHIKNRDYNLKSTLLSMITIFFLFVAVIIHNYIIQFARLYFVYLAVLLLLGTPVMMIVFFCVFFYLLYAKHGYWFQIREMKADRLACGLIPEIREGMILLLKRLRIEEDELEPDKPWFKKIPDRYNTWHTHPNLNYRIHLLQHYKKWSYREYVTHFFQTLKWAMTGRGWSGS